MMPFLECIGSSGQLHWMYKLDMFKGGVFRHVSSFENTSFKNRQKKKKELWPDTRLQEIDGYNPKKEKRIKVGKRKQQHRVYQGPALSPKYICLV